MAEDSEKDDASPTLRDLEGPTVSGDTLPDVAGLYVAPRPVPEASQHRTLDLRPVRLSPEVDPRQALTARRLDAPGRPSRRPSLFLVAVVLSLVILAVVGVSAALSTSTGAPVHASEALRPPPRPEPVRAAPPAAAAPTPAPPPPRAQPSALPAERPATESVKLPVAPKRSTPSPREPEPKRKGPWLE